MMMENKTIVITGIFGNQCSANDIQISSYINVIVIKGAMIITTDLKRLKI